MEEKDSILQNIYLLTSTHRDVILIINIYTLFIQVDSGIHSGTHPGYLTLSHTIDYGIPAAKPSGIPDQSLPSTIIHKRQAVGFPFRVI